MQEIDFDRITPDEFNQWLNQSVNRYRFRQLMPLADKQAKFAKNAGDERAVFGLLSPTAMQSPTATNGYMISMFARPAGYKPLFFADVLQRISLTVDDASL